MQDTNGKPFQFKDVKAKYTVIDFWASWCGPCRAANTEIVKIYQAYKGKGLEIIGVSLDEERKN